MPTCSRSSPSARSTTRRRGRRCGSCRCRAGRAVRVGPRSPSGRPERDRILQECQHARRSCPFLPAVRHALHHRNRDVEGHGVDRFDERRAPDVRLVTPVHVALTRWQHGAKLQQRPSSRSWTHGRAQVHIALRRHPNALVDERAIDHESAGADGPTASNEATAVASALSVSVTRPL